MSQPELLMRKFCVLILAISFVAVNGQNEFRFVRERLEAGQTHPAASLLDTIARNGGQKDSVHYYRAMVHLQGGRINAAHHEVEELEKMSGSSSLGYLKGLMHFREEKYAHAVEAFSDFLASHPAHVKSLLNRSLALGLMDNFDEAIADLDAVLKIDPSHADAYYSRGYWHEFAGRYDEAAKSYEKCITLNPRNYDAYLGLAFAYHRQHDDVRACETVEKAVRAGSQIAAEVRDNYCR
jgi:tetratricopeptide (TPR) repeat protein